MFQIQPVPEPAWRTMAKGIRFKYRYGPTEALQAARRAARAAVKADPEADAYLAFAVGAAVWGVVEWEGLGVEGATEAVAVTPELMTALLRQRPDVFDEHEAHFVGPLMELLLEKND